jgi:hypothetical protein
MSKTGGPEYWWVTVGGSSSEPATVVRRKLIGPGETNIREHIVAYTCGCADPFFVDETDCALKLIEMCSDIPDARDEGTQPVPSRFHGYQNFREEAP